MALLASCWLLIEFFIIPDGFQRWFYLSFYIHPILLVLCQIFLWLKLLQKWIVLILYSPFQIARFVFSPIFNYLRCYIISLFPITKSTDTEVVVEDVDQNQIVNSHMRYEVITYVQEKIFEVDHSYKVGSVLYVDESDMEESCVDINDDTSLKEFLSSASDSNSLGGDVDMADFLSSICSNSSRDMEMDEYLPSICSTNSPGEDVELADFSSSICISPTDMEMDVHMPPVYSANSPVMEQELISESDEEEVDSFYKKYTQEMRWFDLLSHDRIFGISAILNNRSDLHHLFENRKAVDNISVPYMSWSKMDRKRLLRSLENDIEMVYVAQSCLSWEALHHHYINVEALACSQNGVFYNDVAGRFQKFQILLERFTEEQMFMFEGKRYWNYVQNRSSLKSLLQVPEVSGYMEEEKEGMNGEAMRATEVLKAIEKCIKAFWVYVKTDKKQPGWKFKTLLWTRPTLEDPRDLKLLSNLTKTLQKKELWLKGLEGKKRCWVKRVVNPISEYQKRDILFTMIDMKLVTRVLKMSVISTSQLQWCQEKLNNLDFNERMAIIRAPTGPLFPSS